MQEINGVKVYENDEHIPALDGIGLPPADQEGPWGWKIQESNGVRTLVPATEVDYREFLAQKHGVPPDQVALHAGDQPWCSHINPNGWNPFKCFSGECKPGWSCKPHMWVGGIYCDCAQ